VLVPGAVEGEAVGHRPLDAVCQDVWGRNGQEGRERECVRESVRERGERQRRLGKEEKERREGKERREEKERRQKRGYTKTRFGLVTH
jgi:hypothetical protein